MAIIEPNDLVALLVDLPPHGLRRGDVGTVLEVFAANEHHPGGYLLEFLDEATGEWRELDVTDASLVVRLHLTRLAA